ncbi:MAG: hypothetical protein ACXW2L_16435 [Burkholderiales bacterium]
MPKSWHFFAVRAATPSGFRWQWQKQGTTVIVSAPFDYYFDCISNARDKGYAGPPPAGPNVPLQHLPTGRSKRTRISRAASTSHDVVMTVAAVSAGDVKQRRTI